MFFQQIMGTSMGTIWTPPSASIFMRKIENQILNHAPHPIHFWRRFIEDCFFIFTRGEDKLQEVLNYINDVHPIKFTFKYSPTTIDFLDTSIHLGEHGKLFSKVYSKPTDTFTLLDFMSKPSSRNKIINYLLTST